jgi:hypothetical protein
MKIRELTKPVEVRKFELEISNHELEILVNALRDMCCDDAEALAKTLAAKLA